MLFPLIVAPTSPVVTLDEIEIGVPALAAKYAAAVGEPVEVVPALERRAVAIFAKAKPWSEVMALAGEAGDFALVREDEKLRLQPTRGSSFSTIEKRLNALAKTELVVPNDLRVAVARRKEAVLGQDDPLLPQTLNETKVVSSPAALIGGRLLAAGTTFPLGRTVLFENAPYTLRDHVLFRAQNSEERFTRVRAAFRLTASDLEAAVEFTDGKKFFPQRLRSITIGDAEVDDKPSLALLQAVPWGNAPEPTVSNPVIGDLLRWWHECNGETLSAPALRLAIGGAESSTINPSISDLQEGALGTGFTFRRSGAGVAVRADWIDGAWPLDFRELERSQLPSLAVFARFAGADRPLWRVIDSGLGGVSPGTYGLLQSGIVVRTMPASHVIDWNALRLLGELAPSDFLALISGPKTETRTQNPASLAAIRRYWSRASPDLALEADRLSIRSVTIRGRLKRGGGWRAFDAQGHPWDQWVHTEGKSDGESFVRWRGTPIRFVSRRRIAVETLTLSLAEVNGERQDLGDLATAEIVHATGPVVPIP